MSSRAVCLKELHHVKFNSVEELYKAVKLVFNKYGDAEFLNTVEFCGGVVVRDTFYGKDSNFDNSKAVVGSKGFVWE